MPYHPVELLQFLDTRSIPYQLVCHPAVYTMDEMEKTLSGVQGIPEDSVICKNLFLRDTKGKRHFLVVLCGDKCVDLTALGAQIGAKLSFASEERLHRLLGVQKGSVTPLGVLHDAGHETEIFFDRELANKTVGVHPLENTATVFLAFEDLFSIVRANGNPIEWIDCEKKS